MILIVRDQVVVLHDAFDTRTSVVRIKIEAVRICFSKVWTLENADILEMCGARVHSEGTR